jgi:glutathione S-transferase
MITFYQFGNSVCCQKARITMSEKGLGWEPIEVNLFRNEQYLTEYLKINPKAVVPAMIHDGKTVIESTLICEYLDDVYPTPLLIPKDPYLRSQMRLWSKMVDEGLHEGISEISFSAMFRQRLKNSTPEERDVRFRNIGDPRRRDRFKSTYDLGTQSPFVLYAVAAYYKAFNSMEKALAGNGPWLLGEKLSLADINMMPYVARLHYLGLLDVWIADKPAAKTWWQGVQQLPSFVAGLVAPMKTQEVEEMAKHGPKIRGELEDLLGQIATAQAQFQPASA